MTEPKPLEYPYVTAVSTRKRSPRKISQGVAGLMLAMTKIGLYSEDLARLHSFGAFRRARTGQPKRKAA